MESWNTVWKELRANVSARPACSDHPQYPCVRTLAQGVPNDILDVRVDGILVRSHRTMNEDFIEASRIEKWWDHLVEHGSASLRGRDPNNPHMWRARLVGAIIAVGLPGRVRVADPATLERVGK